VAEFLTRDADPIFWADELAVILNPVCTRGLVAGTGVDPGAPGSGVIPELKVRFSFGSFERPPAARAQLVELGGALQMSILRAYQF
jgi:hypothetical protein